MGLLWHPVSLHWWLGMCQMSQAGASIYNITMWNSFRIWGNIARKSNLLSTPKPMLTCQQTVILTSQNMVTKGTGIFFIHLLNIAQSTDPVFCITLQSRAPLWFREGENCQNCLDAKSERLPATDSCKMWQQFPQLFPLFSKEGNEDIPLSHQTQIRFLCLCFNLTNMYCLSSLSWTRYGW